MTPRQKECLDYISGFWSDNGYAPSFEEIRIALGAKSKSSVSALVKRLEARGYVERILKLSRSVRVISDEQPPASLE
tara:strand:- start:43 stop:273 length:231 start_codon:yes stop_codon:yes gene_type:complete